MPRYAMRCYASPCYAMLGYHVPGLSAKTRLQRELLKKEAVFLWTEEHNKEFLAIREEVGDPNTLWHYDSEMDLGVSIDTQKTNGPNSEAVAGLGFVCFNYYRDPTKAEQTGLGGPLHPKHSGIRALQFGSIAAKDSWKSKPPVVIEGLGAIAALHKLHYFCRGQAVIDLFLDSKTMVEAWCNKGLEEMAPGLQDIMIESPRTVTPDTPTLEAMQLMREERVGCLPVCEDGRLVGIITQSDLIRVSAHLLEKFLKGER